MRVLPLGILKSMKRRCAASVRGQGCRQEAGER